jgi:acyl carrier protein
MDDIAARTAGILKAHLRPRDRAIDRATTLQSLGLDGLEVALVVLDLEDHFGIDVPFDPDAAAQDLPTVGALFERVERLVNAKACRRTQRASPTPARPRSLWLRAACPAEG